MDFVGDAYHRIVADPRMRRFGVPLIAAVVGVQTLRWLNRWMSQRALNNFVGNSNWDWKREIVVVTGGSSGIGAAVVELLCARGAKVIILDVNPPTSTSAIFYQADITSREAVAKVGEQIRQDHGPPTVLVNNAGVGSDQLILPTPMKDIRQVFEVNFFSHYHTVKEFLPDMITRNHGHVVTVASGASFASRAANVDYAASKAAVLAFHEGLGAELRLFYDAPKVRTSVVHPPWVKTPMADHLIATGKFHETMVSPQTVASAIVRQLDSGNSGQVFVPEWLGLLAGSRGFPHWMQDMLRMMLSAGTRPALDVLAAQGQHRRGLREE